jgi:hypothetical protein
MCYGWWCVRGNLGQSGQGGDPESVTFGYSLSGSEKQTNGNSEERVFQTVVDAQWPTS